MKKQKKALEIGASRLAKQRAEWESMERDLARLRSTPMSEAEVFAILERHKLALLSSSTSKKGRERADEARPYKTFAGAGKLRFLVGRGPHDNDRLTRQAKANDYWFHVIGVTGSHVIVPFKTLPAGELEPSIRRQAAILALHYSKLRADTGGEVYVTQRRFLRKQKGMPPGLWLVDKSETFFLRYEGDELKKILDSLEEGA